MSDYFSFIWPFMLLSLGLIPLLIWRYRRLRRNQAQAAAALGPLGTAAGGNAALRRRRHIPALFFLAGISALLVALARPQVALSLPRVQGTVILAFDISNSMLADDLEPTRMDAAKEAAQLFVENQPSTIDLGVVAFGVGGLIVQPPTDDRAAVLNALNQLAPEGGTSLGQGIFTSLNAIAGETLAINEEAFDADSGTVTGDFGLADFSSAVILLLTDGENTGNPDPLLVAQAAAEAGVRIYSIGLGSADGAVIEVEGFSLVTALDEVLLQQLADLTNGVYYAAADAATLAEIYDGVDLQLTVEGEMTEVTALLAGLALLFFLIGGALSMRWFGRMP